MNGVVVEASFAKGKWAVRWREFVRAAKMISKRRNIR